MRLFATNATLLILAVPLALLGGEEPARQSFDSNGVKISYIVEGKGDTVVLIHGLYSSIAMNWEMNGVVAMLAKDYQVVALDLRGHGQSDKPDKEEAYGMEMVEDVVRLMDKLNIEKAHIVGYSMGGIIAGKLIAKHPDRALSGLLGGMGWLKEGGVLARVWEMLGRGEGGGLGKGTPPECLHSMGKIAMSEEEIKSIKAPVEMLVGERDPCKKLYVTPAAQARGDWPVVEIADAGHMNCIMKPQFKDEIKKWLEKQKGK